MTCENKWGQNTQDISNNTDNQLEFDMVNSGVIECLLITLIKEQRITNMHLSVLSDIEIQKEEVD